MKRIPFLALLLTLLGLLFVPGLVWADPPPEHQYIEEYEGAATCEKCHLGITDEVAHSIHYTWSEKMDHYSPLPASIPKINWLGILNPDLEIPGGCGRCHVGGGPMPGTPEAVADEAYEQIDCLVCHAEVYDMGERYPVQDEDGNWTIPGDRSLMAARSAARPTDEACLRCHLNAGGGELFKRGLDFAPVADKHAQESYGDIHAEKGMVCVDCHAAPDHLTYGFAPTLWSRDREDDRLACASCHTKTPHENALLNGHERLDCRACHVRETGGLMTRDWTAEPVYDPLKELYGPVDELAPANSVNPTFKWHNGQRLIPSQEWPGSYGDLESYIQPFKIFQGTVPINPKNGRPWPLKLGVFYKTGNLEDAIALGAEAAGMDYSGEWEPKTFSVPLQLSHGIVEADRAATCNECHVPDGRMDFEALGYDAEHIATLQSISSADAGSPKTLQVDVIPDALPAEPKSDDPVEVSGSDNLPIFNTWTLGGVLLIVLVIIAIVAYLLYRQRKRLVG